MPARSRLDRLFSIASVAGKRDLQTQELIGTRCHREAYIARKIGFSEATNQGICYLDEHGNGKDFLEKRKGDEIPLFSRIMNLCQALEVFAAMNSVADAFDVIRERSGSWFDPENVRAAGDKEEDAELWKSLEAEKVRETVTNLEPLGVFLYADDAKLDSVCESFPM